MAPVVLVVDMGVHSSGSLKKMKKDLMKIPGVVEVCASLVTGHVAIIGMADAATLRERLVAKLRRPVFLLADYGAAPAPPVGGGYGGMPPPSPAPSSPFPAPTVGGGYPAYGYRPPTSPVASSALPPPPVGGYCNPYVRYNQLRHAAPPPEAGYYYTPFGGIGRPRRGHYMRNDAPVASFEDERHNGCCCSIQESGFFTVAGTSRCPLCQPAVPQLWVSA